MSNSTFIHLFSRKSHFSRGKLLMLTFDIWALHSTYPGRTHWRLCLLCHCGTVDDSFGQPLCFFHAQFHFIFILDIHFLGGYMFCPRSRLCHGHIVITSYCAPNICSQTAPGAGLCVGRRTRRIETDFPRNIIKSFHIRVNNKLPLTFHNSWWLSEDSEEKLTV